MTHLLLRLTHWLEEYKYPVLVTWLPHLRKSYDQWRNASGGDLWRHFPWRFTEVRWGGECVTTPLFLTAIFILTWCKQLLLLNKFTFYLAILHYGCSLFPLNAIYTRSAISWSELFALYMAFPKMFWYQDLDVFLRLRLGPGCLRSISRIPYLMSLVWPLGHFWRCEANS